MFGEYPRCIARLLLAATGRGSTRGRSPASSFSRSDRGPLSPSPFARASAAACGRTTASGLSGLGRRSHHDQDRTDRRLSLIETDLLLCVTGYGPA